MKCNSTFQFILTLINQFVISPHQSKNKLTQFGIAKFCLRFVLTEKQRDLVTETVISLSFTRDATTALESPEHSVNFQRDYF